MLHSLVSSSDTGATSSSLTSGRLKPQQPRRRSSVSWERWRLQRLLTRSDTCGMREEPWRAPLWWTVHRCSRDERRSTSVEESPATLSQASNLFCSHSQKEESAIWSRKSEEDSRWNISAGWGEECKRCNSLLEQATPAGTSREMWWSLGPTRKQSWSYLMFLM